MPSRAPQDADPVALAMADLDYLLSHPQPGGQPAYSYLPSGRYLHNPAKKTVKSGDAMATKLITNAVAGSAGWVEATLNPSRDPIDAAIGAEAKHKANTERALREGRFKKGLMTVDKSAMRDTITKVGGGALAAGVQARESKIRKKFNELQPKLQSLSDTIQSMPNDNDAANEARVVAAVRGMRKIGGT